MSASRRGCVLLLCSVLLAACESSPVPGRVSDPAGDGLRTTDGAIAMRNLDQQIASAEARLVRLPADVVTVERLVASLLSRAQLRGTYGDWTTAEGVIDRAQKRGAASARLSLIRADLWAAQHRFDQATMALVAAFASDDAPIIRRAAEVQDDIDVARGQRLHPIRERRLQRARTLPSFHHWIDVAAVEHQLGNFEDADRSYQRALTSYRDVSPLPIAWVQFRRGLMWAEHAGLPERAEALYRDAITRVPAFVSANVHLAELEAEGDRINAAIDRLQRVAEGTDDHEPSMRLAEYLAGRDDPAARHHALRARQSYAALMARYPTAFNHHHEPHHVD